jgi:hypothetical protein
MIIETILFALTLMLIGFGMFIGFVVGREYGRRQVHDEQRRGSGPRRRLALRTVHEAPAAGSQRPRNPAALRVVEPGTTLA